MNTEFKLLEQLGKQILPKVQPIISLDINGNYYFNTDNNKYITFLKEKKSGRWSSGIIDKSELTLLPLSVYTLYKNIDEIKKDEIIFINNVANVVIDVKKGGTLVLLNNKGHITHYSMPYDLSTKNRIVEVLNTRLMDSITKPLTFLNAEKILTIKSYIKGEKVSYINKMNTLMNVNKLHIILSNIVPFSLWLRDKDYKAIMIGLIIIDNNYDR